MQKKIVPFVPATRKTKVPIATGEARDFDWKEAKVEKFCDISLVT